jgi:hypothetical protein
MVPPPRLAHSEDGVQVEIRNRASSKSYLHRLIAEYQRIAKVSGSGNDSSINRIRGKKYSVLIDLTVHGVSRYGKMHHCIESILHECKLSICRDNDRICQCRNIVFAIADAGEDAIDCRPISSINIPSPT